MTDRFEIIEELFDLSLMKGTTRWQDIFIEMDSALVKFNLPKGKLLGLSTDGGPVMRGKQNGFVNLMCKSVPHKVLTHHCIIHHEQLYANTVEMKYVMEKVVSEVNFTRSKEINYRQLQSLLAEIRSHHNDVSCVYKQCHLSTVR